jgi:hypothetical protein
MDLAGVEHEGRLRVAVRTADPQTGPSQREGYTTIDGHPALRRFEGTDRYRETLSVWGVNGLVVTVEVSAHPRARDRFAPDGAAGIVRRLEVTADETRWR